MRTMLAAGVKLGLGELDAISRGEDAEPLHIALASAGARLHPSTMRLDFMRTGEPEVVAACSSLLFRLPSGHVAMSGRFPDFRCGVGFLAGIGIEPAEPWRRFAESSVDRWSKTGWISAMMSDWDIAEDVRDLLALGHSPYPVGSEDMHDPDSDSDAEFDCFWDAAARDPIGVALGARDVSSTDQSDIVDELRMHKTARLRELLPGNELDLPSSTSADILQWIV